MKEQVQRIKDLVYKHGYLLDTDDCIQIWHEITPDIPILDVDLWNLISPMVDRLIDENENMLYV